MNPPSASYVDWRGTVIVEDSLIDSSGNLYALAGLDQETWSNLGVEMFAFSHGEEPDWTVHVYAFNRQEHGVDGLDAMKDLEASRGAIPVRDIQLHEREPDRHRQMHEDDSPAVPQEARAAT